MVGRSFLLILLLLTTSGATASLEDPFFRVYKGQKNPFLKDLRQRTEIERYKAELELLNKKLKKYIKREELHKINELNEQKRIIESKLQLLINKHEEIYNRITKITTHSEPYTLVNFFSKKPLKNAHLALESITKVRQEYQEAYNYLKEYKLEVKRRIQASTLEAQQNDLRKLYDTILQDTRYLTGFKELIEKQYEHLLDGRTQAEKQYYDYRDQEILRHLISVVVVVLLLVVAFFLRKVVVRYIKEDERQFMLNRTINTTTAIVGVLFILFTYTENIIYSLTVFTFIGAAAIIATRSFLINIIAWIYMTLSNFIKVGDRILVPHATKYYYGDIINISPVKITLYEAYDFSSTKEAVSAGRIIFVPNSYIFTHAVISYTHQAQKTNFDYLSFSFALDSDLELIETITKELLRTHTGTYLHEAKMQFNALRKRYDVKQRMLEPEIKFDINATSSGIKMTAWYLTPTQQATLVKNRLLKALLERYLAEPSINIMKKAKPASEKEPGEDAEE